VHEAHGNPMEDTMPEALQVVTTGAATTADRPSAARTPATTGYAIRRATPDDKPKILEVMAELLGGDLADLARRHAWLYEANPHGRAITWIAIDEATREVAGCTSFFPRKLWVDGRIALGALGGDGYVRPRFRRRGIMQAMHKRSRAEMPELGIEVMYGTPMPANFTPLATAGSKDVTQVARYVRPISGRAFHVSDPRVDRVVRAILVPRSRAYLDPATINDTRVNEVWGQVRADIGITTVRDAEYITWRHVVSPSQKQHAFVILEGSEAIGVCALERADENMRVIDLVTPQRHWGTALRAIANYAGGCTSVEMRLTFAQAAKHRTWRRGYLLRDRTPHPLNIVLPPGDPGASTFHDGARWYISWTETDRDAT
jgi:hypothetical protein